MNKTYNMKKTIRLTESDLNNLIKRVINEIHSDKDMQRGEELGKTSFGIEAKFKGDYRKDKLIIKKLVRIKSRIEDEQLRNEIDNVLDMLENNDDTHGVMFTKE